MAAKYASLFRKNSTTNDRASLAKASTKNTEIKGDVRDRQYSKAVDSRSQTRDNVEDSRGTKSACRCPRMPQAEHSSQLETKLRPCVEQKYEKPEWLECFVQGCQKKNCFDEIGALPIRYQSSGESCEPEFVHPGPFVDRNRRPQLPEPPEMLSFLKRGIRHPFQITHRRKEMQTHLDKLTDEHEAFAFPPGTRRFVDDVYYSTNPASSMMENFDVVCRDIRTQKFLECTTRRSLLAFHRDKYKFFRERLPMPQKRVVNIPGNRKTHWHNWVIRPLRTTYSESWRKDVIVPDNWLGPAPPHIC